MPVIGMFLLVILLGNALMRSGQTAEARSEYEEVLRQDPENAVARRILDRLR